MSAGALQPVNIAPVTSSRRQRIAIVTHRSESFEAAPYFLGFVAEVWREMGFQVDVINGPREGFEADVGVLHVDLTRVPADHVQFVQGFPISINGRVDDISKRRISRHVVKRGDGYEGPVIVKTNFNYGGVKEAALAARLSRVKRYTIAARQRLPWSMRSRFWSANYRVFDSVRDVPRMVWYNPSLVVEKFLAERHEGFYCLRTWLFLGDRETNSLSYSRDRVIKSSNVVRRELGGEPPEELRRVRREMGFEYGKFDYAIVDGQVVLYDTNRTPTMGSFSKVQYLPRVKYFAEGIEALLR